MVNVKSLLCGPAEKYDVVSRAIMTGASVAHFDLEDSVPLSRKSATRAAILKQLKHPIPIPTAVRINALNTQLGLEDILGFIHQNVAPDIMIVPKVESPETARIAGDILKEHFPETRIFCVIESIKALKSLDRIILEPDFIQGMIFGAADFSGDMGKVPSALDLTYAKTQIALAANQINAVAIDSPCFQIHDVLRLETECLQARALGFHGKIAIHPGQVSRINQAFAPTEHEYTFSKNILDTLTGPDEREASSIRTVGENMIGPPFIRIAEKIVKSME
ncbi:CoA ester lyase [Photobacterium sp. GJ3]|uniref:HpcH/HpaI aldolase/citrate lyase family protein n=1 Tax=Photobacterium sp. GJ3 TaxID=2829502 RepID=UPI001B8CA3F6|nr:CoA ester lyase [Photobacterium sp. GJ3]QUJ68043.1 CoA ester lyase [Photobacterium sp. GJ3]